MNRLFYFCIAILLAVGVQAQTDAGQTRTHADLVWAEAKGPVKTIVERVPEDPRSYAQTIVYQFDRSGKLVSYTTRDAKQRIKRYPTDGRIQYIYDLYPCEPCGDGSMMDLGVTYSYNEKGLPTKVQGSYLECADEITQRFDDEGWLRSASGQAMGDCDDSERTYTYTYPEIDARGNWTKRRTQARFVSYDGVPTTHISITTREITYWE